MGTIIKTGAAIGVLAFLGACAPTPAYYGEAVAYNKAIQTINPAPVYSEDGAQPGDNGERAVGAVEAYRSGSVDIGGGAGGAGAGGGGGAGGSFGGLGAATGPR